MPQGRGREHGVEPLMARAGGQGQEEGQALWCNGAPMVRADKGRLHETEEAWYGQDVLHYVRR